MDPPGSGPKSNPFLSSVALRSVISKGNPPDFRESRPSDHSFYNIDPPGPGSGSKPSSVSLKSFDSKGNPPDFRESVPADQRESDPKEPLDYIFTHLENDIVTFIKAELKRLHGLLVSKYTESSSESQEEQSSREAVLNITLDFLRRMKQEQLAECLSIRSSVGVSRDKLKRHLQQRFSHVFEGVATAGNSAPLHQIYTELYITEGGASEVNQEHEVRQIETASRKPSATEISITCEDLFKGHVQRQQPISADQTEEQSIRTVMTLGVAGVGKTVLTQKFILDWAEGRSHQDVHLLFPFTFRELNVLRKRSFSLMGLVQHFFNQTKGLSSLQHLQLLFIFDGLDECRLPLDFIGTRVLTEPTESASVEELLVNIIRGDLLPSALLWITTRPAAANQIPAQCVSMVTEVRGFTDPQKEQYFKKRFRDDSTSVISYIRNIRSLFIMCHIPIFCWILSIVLLHLMENKEKVELPTTLTQMYIHFLVVQAKIKNIKYYQRSGADLHWTEETKKMMWSLGKLAFEQLQKGNLIFYESDLSECGLDAAEIARYSGVFTQVFREEPGLYQDKVYCFIHLSVQEFLAALHVHQTFFNTKENLLSLRHNAPHSVLSFYRSAVDQALMSQNGHHDMFLRFLLGLSLSTNQKLLSGLLTETGSETVNHDTVGYIKNKLNEEGVSVERSLNLLHCLNELNDRSLTEEIQKILREGSLNDRQMSSAQWTALSFLLLSSDSDLEEFDLKKFCPSEKGLEKLLMVVKASRKANLSFCDLKLWSCRQLASVLSCSSLTDLHLSNNNLRDSGVNELCHGLKSATCRLMTLNLSCCGLTALSCSFLASVLSSSSLIHLDLSNNDLQDSGVERLCEGLKSAPCRLETLRLSGCVISERGGASLASALRSRIRELDVSYNHPGASIQRLTTLQAPEGHLHTLRWKPTGAQYLTMGLSKYFCELSLGPNTANTANQQLKMSDNNRTVVYSNPDSSPPVLCSPALTGRCYWEVDLSLKPKSSVYVAVTYIGKGDSDFGQSPHSWALRISRRRYTVIHNGESKELTHPAPYSYPARVAVYLDYEAGYLSFFEDHSQILQPLHTFHTTFTEPVYAAFML